MTSAIRKYLGDFIALLVLIALGSGIGAYILSNQRLRFPIVEEAPTKIEVVFQDAQAVVSGQGQTVRIAGVKVGDIADVELENGRAVVTMDIDPEYSDRIHADATALLRPKTGLKDMFIELDPGTERQPTLGEGDRIPVENTLPDIDPDEFLSALDTDTRAYLQLLINGAGKGLRGRGDDLREVFVRLEPLYEDLNRVNASLARRRRNLARLVHNYSSLVDELADHDGELARLVTASADVFNAFASQDTNLSATVARLPGTLRQAERTLGDIEEFSPLLSSSLESLRPVFRQIDETNPAVARLAREAEPQVRGQIRPFVREARPYLRNLRPAAADLGEALPDLRDSFFQINRFFNMAAYNPGGREALPSDPVAARNRDEGYLFWVAWVGHLTNSIFSTSDATGTLRRSLFSVTCSTLREVILAEEPALEPVLGVTDVLDDAGVCPGGGSG